MKKLLFSLYGFAFFNKFLLLAPVYAIFMQQNGVSDLQLSTMFIVSACGTVLGQVPITYITGRLGQRNAMIFGQLLKIAAVLLWLVMPNYAGFATGMVLWGVQAGFRAVAFEGLLYDSVDALGGSDDFARILGRKSTYESAGTALSACGSLLLFFGYTWVTWASVASVLLSILCLLMVSSSYGKVVAPRASIKIHRLFKTGIRICLQTPCLLSVMILCLLVFNIPFLDDFLSPIALQLGIPTEYVGVLPFFLLGCATLGQRFAYKFTRLSNTLLYVLILTVGVGYVSFGMIYTSDALWIMGVSYILFYGLGTLLYAQFQDKIPTRHRSVVLSLYTTLVYLVYMAVCGLIGLGATLGSWRYSIIAQGILMSLVGIIAWVRIRNKCDLTIEDNK